MPGLDLLAEDCHDTIRVLFEECLAQGRAVDGFEELGAEGADVIEICNDVRETGKLGGIWRAYRSRLYGRLWVGWRLKRASAQRTWVREPF